MTTIQMLKNNLENLKEKLVNFDEFNLNRSKAKDVLIQNVDDEYTLSFPEEDNNFSHFIKKGVKSDFIKIFRAKTKTDKYSIAFHFSYIEK